MQQSERIAGKAINTSLSIKLFKSEDSTTKKAMLEVSQLLVDTLVENVLSLDESAGNSIELY